MKNTTLLLATLLALLLLPLPLFARGFGGGGFRGGGGFGGGGFDRGGFGGGGFGGGGFDRGAFGGGGLGGGGLGGGGFDRGGLGGGNFGGGNLGGLGGGEFGGNRGGLGNFGDGLNRGGLGNFGDGLNRNSIGNFGDGLNRGGLGGGEFGGLGSGNFSGANRSQLNSFLGLPSDGGMHAASSGSFDRGAISGADGGAAWRGGTTGHTFEGPNGSTIHTGTAAGQGIAGGPGGVVAGGGVAHGTVVKGPNGNVYAHGEAAGRGIAAGPNGVVAGRGAVGYRGFDAGGVHYSGTWCRAQGVACNRWYAGRPFFNAGWCNVHPWGWCPGRYTAAAWATACWNAATWASVTGWYLPDAQPVYYDYGNNVTYNQDGYVYYGDQPAATTQQYYQQAQTIANAGAQNPPDDADWLPLGVWGLMKTTPPADTSNGGGQTDPFAPQPAQPASAKPEMVFQLAVNKQGTIRGNYYDQVSDSSLPVTGSVDKKTQRACWRVTSNKEIVVETGLYNLTQEQAACLVHFGADRTVQYLMTRIKQDDKGAGAAAE